MSQWASFGAAGPARHVGHAAPMSDLFDRYAKVESRVRALELTSTTRLRRNSTGVLQVTVQKAQTMSIRSEPLGELAPVMSDLWITALRSQSAHQQGATPEHEGLGSVSEAIGLSQKGIPS
jgi:hypothetical protein